MADLYIYKTSFEPILLPGEIAHLITSSKELNVECVAVGALPEYQADFGALTAATWDSDNEDTNLEMNRNEFAQFRMRILDDIQMRFNNLGPTRQWRTGRTNFVLKQFPQNSGDDWLKEYMFKASEFFVYEDETPRFDFYSEIALATARVIFSGWRYRFKQVAQGAMPSKRILISGWPSS